MQEYIQYAVTLMREIINKYSAETFILYAGLAFLIFLFGIFTLAGFWGMLSKSGEKGWKILIPFYNLYMLVRLSEQKGILFLLLFIPVINMVFWLITLFKIAKRFGKSVLYGIGLFFIPEVFTLILGFGKAECANPKPEEDEDYYYYYKPVEF